MEGETKINFQIDLASNEVELYESKKAFENIMLDYKAIKCQDMSDPNYLNADRDFRTIKSARGMLGGYEKIKTVLYAVALIFCIISTIYVVSLYFINKKKDIAICYAYGLSFGRILFMIVKELAITVVSSLLTAFALESVN